MKEPLVILPYSRERVPMRQSRAGWLLVGLMLPYLYGWVAYNLLALWLWETRDSDKIAAYLYTLNPWTISTITGFPLLIWLIYRRARARGSKSRGFIPGVLIGLLLLPVIAGCLAVVSFRHGV